MPLNVKTSNSTHAEPLPYKAFLLSLALSVMVTEMATDIYLMAQKILMVTFKTTPAAIMYSFSAYMVGMGLSIPIYGMLADKIGRRPVLLGAMGIFSLGSLLCPFSPTIEYLWVIRGFQGIGGGGAYIIAMTALSDRFAGNSLARAISLLQASIALSPAFSPIIGAWLLTLYNWKMNFYFLGAMAVCTWLFLWRYMPETHSEPRASFSCMAAFQAYCRVFKDPTFLSLTLLSALPFGALWAYLSGVTLYVLDKLHLDPWHFSLFQASEVLAYIAATLLNSRVLTYRDPFTLLGYGVWCCLSGAIFLALTALYAAGAISMIITAMCVFSFGLGFVFSNGVTLVMAAKTPHKGIRAASLSSTELLLPALVAWIIGHIYQERLLEPAISMLVIMLLTMVVYLWVSQQRTQGCKKNFPIDG